MPADALFQPFTFKGLHLPNRIVMAPMTRSMSPGGVPTPDVAGYYARRAGAQVGLIVSEGVGVERAVSVNSTSIPRFHGEAALAGWKTVIDGVHAAGGRMSPQLWHVGAVPGRGDDEAHADAHDSPSGLRAPGVAHGAPMSDADVADTIAAFATAAADAQALGFDAVELHGAHGYLIDQFFWEGTNIRAAASYGGPTIAERSKFAAEIIAAVRAAVGPDYPLIIRISQWKQQDFAVRVATTPKEMETWLTTLVDAGADIIHC